VLALRNNPDRVEITDQQAIPLEFMCSRNHRLRTRTKAAIKKAIQAGEEVPGADIVYGNNRLEIK